MSDSSDDLVELEITDVLDLHSFPPQQVRDLVRDYLEEAVARGFEQVRIVHGKGIGAQRKSVRKLLEGDARVADFGDAPATAGGWGATWARLRPS